MLDFEVQRCSRKCHASERNLEPGEVFFSVLIAEGSEVRRYDYSAQAWEGPPENAIGWWQAQMPDLSGKKVQLAPSEVLQQYFEQLQSLEGQEELAYLLALLMVRRRLLRLDDTKNNEQGQEVLVVYSPRTETTHEVLVVEPSEARILQIKEELGRLLYADAS